MSEKQLRDLIGYASGFAEKRFRQAGATFPMWHVVLADGKQFATPPPLGSTKDEAVAIMRALFELRDAVRYIYFDEAWTVLKPLGPDAIAFMNKHGVRAHPDRVEIVMFTGEDRECGQLMAHRRIIRPTTGRPTLGPLEWLDDMLGADDRRRGVQSEGRMVGFLPVKGMRQ